MNIGRIKQIAAIFLACTVGTVIFQLVFPIMLGILVNGLPFAVVFLIYDLAVHKKMRFHLDWNSKNGEKDKVLKWYEERGQKRLQNIIASQYAKGIYECWIRQDGICNVRTEKGFRRAGSLPGYPGEAKEMVAELLRKDGLNAVAQKKFLYLSWAED